MGIVEDRHFQALRPEDPDDYRPNTVVAFVIDPTSSDGRHVRSLSFLFEICAPGDFVPLLTHEMDEAIVIDEGEAVVILGDERRTVQPGTVVFIPAGAKHAWGNPGTSLYGHTGCFPAT